MLDVLLVCGAVTVPWGLLTGSALPFGILSLVTLITVGLRDGASKQAP